MINYIGIRRETKSGEKRTPLVPSAIKKLKEEHNIQVLIQPSSTRAYNDEEYVAAGGIIQEDLEKCPVIFGIKEMTLDVFQPDKAYVTFHHVIKGQKSNMSMLKYMMEMGSTMIDYEKVTDASNKRLIFFGQHAGYAGMVDTLYGLGLRLKDVDKLNTPLLKVKQACDYFDLNEAKKALLEVNQLIKKDGFPQQICPLVIGFIGYGNVSKGAQEILDLLPIKEIKPEDLVKCIKNPDKKEYRNVIYKVVFKEEHLVQPRDEGVEFVLKTYYDYPEHFESVFAKNYLKYLTVIVNGAYWASQYPQWVTKQDLIYLYSQEKPPKLKFIGDISCDIEGGIEATIRISYIERPFYVYNPFTDAAIDGVKGIGPAILAIDHLPTEIPRDASEYFSDKLLPFVPNIAKANYNSQLKDSKLCEEISDAVILWRGELTPDFRYIEEFLEDED